ncbi:MAG: substrate-binding domain-containing protein, partial [Acidimicrobiales bacterium]
TEVSLYYRKVFNRIARGLRSGRYGVQALWLPIEQDAASYDALTLDYYMRLASAMAKAFFTRGDVVMLIPPVGSSEKLVPLPIDGAIVVEPSDDDTRLAALRRLDIPTVTIERNPIYPDDPWCVASDTSDEIETLLEHLAAEGAERIAFLVPEAMGTWPKEEREAYRTWSLRHGRDAVTRSASMHTAFESARREVRSMLGSRPTPDAVVIGAERFVSGTMRALADAGLSVPDDILVAVAVDGNHARSSTPPLTAVDLQPEQQAVAAAELLWRRLDGEEPPGQRTVPVILRVRESSRRSVQRGRLRSSEGRLLGSADRRPFGLCAPIDVRTTDLYGANTIWQA